MPSQTHIVLGGNGVTGTETIKALLGRGESVTSVSRTPGRFKNVPSQITDLRESTEVLKLMSGKDVAYFTVGLPYSARIWAEYGQQSWVM